MSRRSFSVRIPITGYFEIDVYALDRDSAIERAESKCREVFPNGGPHLLGFKKGLIDGISILGNEPDVEENTED